MGYRFIDEVTIHVRSGNGGAGSVSFRREKYIPYGGPDGGNGGRGGDVIVRADTQLSTLLDYKFKPRQFAKNGQPGEGNSCSGKDGAPCLIRVPVGTTIHHVESGELLSDLDEDGAEFIVAKGGRGGKGNEHFKSSTRQAPRFSQPGEPGEDFKVRLELKLLADVGLVGFPSVGKSSLIARISAARPKIAEYPFTTLTPNLGVVKFGDLQHYVVADVPGLIPGAHTGAGLGTRFLRHIERVGVIAHLVTGELDETRDPISDYEQIEAEICQHNPALADLPRVIVLNKVDLDFVRDHLDAVRDYAETNDIPFFAVSAATGEEIQALVNRLGEMVHRHKTG